MSKGVSTRSSASIWARNDLDNGVTLYKFMSTKPTNKSEEDYRYAPLDEGSLYAKITNLDNQSSKLFAATPGEEVYVSINFLIGLGCREDFWANPTSK